MINNACYMIMIHHDIDPPPTKTPPPCPASHPATLMLDPGLLIILLRITPKCRSRASPGGPGTTQRATVA